MPKRHRRCPVTWALVWLFSCGTGASGVSECRTLELARCEAAAACGYPDVAECRSYLRDHCLHGLPVSEVQAGEVDACLQTVEGAGACASRDGLEAMATECTEQLQPILPETLACDIVLRPERAAACAFLSGDTMGDESDAS